MPRSTQSPLARVLEYFRTVNLQILPEAYGLVQDVVRQRHGKSEKAKARATAPAVVASPVAAPKATTKKVKAKKGWPKGKKRGAKVAARPSMPLPDPGPDTEVIEPLETGELVEA